MPAWDVLLDLLIMLAAALVLGTVAERLRQSAVLGYLLAGTLVGPNVLGLVREGEHVHAIAELGVALLLFAIGLDISLRRLKRLGSTALLAGAIQVTATTAVAAVVSIVFGVDWRGGIAVGAVVTLSSTGCVVRLLMDRGAIDSLYGRSALGILLFQDVAVIPLLLVIVTLQGGGSPGEAAIVFGRTVLFAALLVAGLWVLLVHVVPRLLNIEHWSRNRELPILLAVVLAAGSAYAARAASLSPAIGAFVAGVLLAGSPFATQIRADVGALRTLLVTLFFAAIGMLGDPAWVLDHWLLVAGAAALVIAGKVVVTWLTLRFLGLTHGSAVATGLCLAQVGEFSFVLAETAREGASPIIGEDVFRLVVSLTIATLFVTPFLVAAAPRVADRIERTRRARAAPPAPTAATPAAPSGAAGERRGAEAAISDASAATAAPPGEERPRRPIVIIGFGPAGQSVANALHAHHKEDMVVVELNPRTGAIARRYGLPVHQGDATHRDVLEHAGVQHAQVIAITVPDPGMSRTIIHLCRALAPGAAVIARSRYHVRRWELAMAGATEVVDEEEQVGLRLAAMTRRHLHGGSAEEGGA